MQGDRKSIWKGNNRERKRKKLPSSLIFSMSKHRMFLDVRFLLSNVQSLLETRATWHPIPIYIKFKISKYLQKRL